MKKKAEPRSSRLYSEGQLPGTRHSNTIRWLATVERLLQQYIRIERAKYDPRGRNRLEELDDHNALFLTRTGKPYSRSAYYHHRNRLGTAFLPLHRVSLKRKRLWNSLLMISDTYTSRAQLPKTRKDVHGDASVESAQLERFRHIIKWRSPEAMNISIKTMNKRQAMLDDEGAQEQDTANAQAAYSKWIETSPLGNSPTETSSSREDAEFD